MSRVFGGWREASHRFPETRTDAYYPPRSSTFSRLYANYPVLLCLNGIKSVAEHTAWLWHTRAPRWHKQPGGLRFKMLSSWSHTPVPFYIHCRFDCFYWEMRSVIFMCPSNRRNVLTKSTSWSRKLGEWFLDLIKKYCNFNSWSFTFMKTFLLVDYFRIQLQNTLLKCRSLSIVRRRLEHDLFVNIFFVFA